MTGKRNELMTAPVIASRTPVFAPSLKGGMTNWRISSVYGTASVKGKLTQVHRNILDAMFAFAIKTRELGNGALEMLVDPYTITKETGSSRDYKWLKAKLHDMKQADVEIIDASGLQHFGGIVSEWREANVRVPMPGGALNGERPLLAVTISSVWMRLYNVKLTVSYKELIRDIAEQPSGVLQSLIRYCLTQRELNKKLDTLLEEIGAITSSTSRSQRFEIKKQVKAADLTGFGIEIKNEVVFYKQHPKVFFRNPEQQDKGGVKRGGVRSSVR